MPVLATGRLPALLLRAAVVLAAGSLAACADEDPSYPAAPDHIEPLTVQANPDALQLPVPLEAVGMQFRVPRGWAPLDSGAARRVQRSVRVAAEGLRMEPLRTYGEQRTSSFLVVSHLRSVDADSTVQAIVARTLAAHEPDFQRVDTLRQDGGRPLFDVVIASRDAVHHKVLVGPPGREAVQFDYVVPRIQYPRAAPLIGASIASVQKNR